MRKLLLSLMTVLIIGSGLMAQGFTIMVSGLVTDTNNQPIANHQVYIMTDSSNSPVVIFTQAYTGINGTYQAVLTVPSTLPPNIIVSTVNCNNTMLTQFFPNVTQAVVANFVICAYTPPPPCSNNFTWTSNLLGSTYTFAGMVIPQGPATYSWSFGDGTGGSGQTVQHTYAFTGIYTVTLTTVSNNCTSTSSQTIMIGQPPVCQAMFNFQGTPGSPLTISFNNLSSGGPNANYHWSFGDNSFSNQYSPTHTYAQGGVYSICLTLIDSLANCYDIYCDSVMVGNTVPPCPSSFTKQVSGSTVAFHGSAVNGSTNVTYTWDFGDNTSGSGQNVTHTYSQPGTYSVCLTTTTALSCTYTSCQPVVIGGATGCQAHFSWMPDSTGTGIVFFNNSVGNATTWNWNFGDATSSNQQQPGVHFYNGSGPYMVCLTITGPNNCQSTFCDTVYLQNAGCIGHFTHSSQPANPLSVTFSGFSPNMNAQFQWDFGDGTFGNGQTVTHTYQQGGFKNVCMKIIGGGLVCPPICQTVQVGGPNPGVPSIAGVVKCFNTPADFGLVFLIEYDTVTNTLTAIDTVALDSNGFFFFHNVAHGKYFLKAALLPTSVNYFSYMPTYYGNSLTWNYAQYVNVTIAQPAILIQLPLIAGANPGGPGFIGGNVNNGANKGEPIEGVEVMITDMSDNPLAYSWSNDKGQFSMTNLPLGMYKVYADIPGLNSVPGIISLSAGSPGMSNIQIIVSSTQVTVGFADVSETIEYIGQVFPNPSNGTLGIELGMTGQNSLTFNVFDQSGRLINSERRELGLGIGIQEFDVQNLAPGFYIMTIQSNEGVNVARTFIKR
jgi:PKD repeat protein